MVEIEGSTTRIYMRIRLMNVLGNRGVCRDTTRGSRPFVVFHEVGANTEDRVMFTGLCRLTGKLKKSCERQTENG